MNNKFKIGEYIIARYKGITIFSKCVSKIGGRWEFEFLYCVKGDVVKNAAGAEFIVPKGVVITRGMKERIGYEIILLADDYRGIKSFHIFPTSAPRGLVLQVATKEEIEKYKPLAMLNQL